MQIASIVNGSNPIISLFSKSAMNSTPLISCDCRIGNLLRAVAIELTSAMVRKSHIESTPAESEYSARSGDESFVSFGNGLAARNDICRLSIFERVLENSAICSSIWSKDRRMSCTSLFLKSFKSSLRSVSHQREYADHRSKRFNAESVNHKASCMVRKFWRTHGTMQETDYNYKSGAISCRW